MEDVMSEYFERIYNVNYFCGSFEIAEFLDRVILWQNNQTITSSFIDEMCWHGQIDVLLDKRLVQKVIHGKRCKRIAFTLFREKFREPKMVEILANYCATTNSPEQMIEWIEYFSISKDILFTEIKKVSGNAEVYKNYKFVRAIKKYYRRRQIIVPINFL